MMRSMFSGVSGLRVHQTKMDVIGNNIANVNTTGFKSARVTFNEIFSQTLQGGSAANEGTGRGGRNPMQVGLGVNVASIDNLMTQGAAQRTDNPFDLMIEDDGFFVVQDASGIKFTRDGSFRVDEQGNLINSQGMRVCGWNPNEDGTEIQKAPVKPLSIYSGDSASAPPKATSDIRWEGNLSTSDDEAIIMMNFFDSLGNEYSVPIKATRDKGTDENANTWNLEIQTTTVNDDEENEEKVEKVVIGFNGKSYTVGGGTFTLGTAKDKYTSLEFDTKGKLKAPTNPITLASNNGKLELIPMDGQSTDIAIEIDNINMNIDVSGITQYNQKTTVQSYRGSADGGSGAGQAPGELNGVNIGTDGIITGRYTNGDTKVLGQIAVAKFRNPAGLQKVGNNLFDSTPNSGDFDMIGTDPVLNAGVLEMSNVDLSREFTEMITTQRGFQANSRVITSSDEMLQELVNLKR